MNSLKYIETEIISSSDFEGISRSGSSADSKLQKHIERKGVLQSLLVRTTDNGYKVIDGNRRLKAAKKTETEKVPCIIIKDCSDERAKALAVALNRLQEESDPTVLTDVLRKLKDEDLDDGEIKRIFHSSVHDQIADLLERIEFEEKLEIATEEPSGEGAVANPGDHLKTGPFYKRLQFEKEERKAEFSNRLEEQKDEGQNSGEAILEVLQDIDLAKSRDSGGDSQ